MRLQLALNVDDLDQAIEFYSKMFGTEPAKTKPGYANFAIENPPLKLVLFEGAGPAGSINHLGVETETAAEVVAAEAAPRQLRTRDHRRRRHHLLLRREDRDLGPRPRRQPLGVVRQARRHRTTRQHRRVQHHRLLGRLLRLTTRTPEPMSVDGDPTEHRCEIGCVAPQSAPNLPAAASVDLRSSPSRPPVT